MKTPLVLNPQTFSCSATLGNNVYTYWAVWQYKGSPETEKKENKKKTLPLNSPETIGFLYCRTQDNRKTITRFIPYETLPRHLEDVSAGTMLGWLASYRLGTGAGSWWMIRRLLLEEMAAYPYPKCGGCTMGVCYTGYLGLAASPHAILVTAHETPATRQVSADIIHLNYGLGCPCLMAHSI